MKLKLANSLINHIVFVIDESSSMSSNKEDVINVFDAQIKYLAQRSQELDQETRVSVYSFADRVECLVYDKDVMRLPSLRGNYQPSGMTALLDGTGTAITDLEKTATLYGDHAFLVYVLTDGAENRSRTWTKSSLAAKLNKLDDNWTVAVFVPDRYAAKTAEAYGFHENNIDVWEVNKRGAVVEVSDKIRKTTDSYMTGRAAGVRGTKSLFQMNSNVSSTQVKSKLEQLKGSEYEILHVRKDGRIDEFVKSWTGEYRQGSAYYQLMKKETIQAQKALLIKEKKSGKVFSGDAARQMLGLPSHEVKVAPAHLAGYDIFVQSTSVNRKLISGTELIVLK